MNDKAPTYFTDDHAASMTLRDYFAAKAMLGLITEPVEGIGEAMFVNPTDNVCRAIASAAYAIADAMLKARKT
jgi:hypothetical protein